MAFGQAVTTFVGQNFGAGQFQRICCLGLIGLELGCVVTIFISGIVLVFPKSVEKCFVNEQERTERLQGKL